MEMLNIEQVKDLKNAFEEAKKDDTPYIGMNDEEIHVLGNPNKTEINSADYVVHFGFPNTEEWRARAEMHGDKIGKTTSDGSYFFAERTLKNVYLSPRRMGAVLAALTQIETFIYRVTENGEVKDLSEEEMKALLTVMNGELSDATYDVVATVLRIPYDEAEWMLLPNTVENAVKIALNNPSVVNESDLFFGSPRKGY